MNCTSSGSPTETRRLSNSHSCTVVVPSSCAFSHTSNATLSRSTFSTSPSRNDVPLQPGISRCLSFGTTNTTTYTTSTTAAAANAASNSADILPDPQTLSTPNHPPPLLNAVLCNTRRQHLQHSTSLTVLPPTASKSRGIAAHRRYDHPLLLPLLSSQRRVMRHKETAFTRLHQPHSVTANRLEEQRFRSPPKVWPLGFVALINVGAEQGPSGSPYR
mmetsp:Transcript_12617/g.38625  ORF Transcript_12617/g.38625 Transcript_12617/m.38625 type:complete len:217 (-) Transcript_12617:609-1259(-)